MPAHFTPAPIGPVPVSASATPSSAEGTKGYKPHWVSAGPVNGQLPAGKVAAILAGSKLPEQKLRQIWGAVGAFGHSMHARCRPASSHCQAS